MKICLVCEGISDTEQASCASCGLPLVKTSEVHFPLRRGEEDAANPLLGALIDGKYRVTNVLGKGGMGTVFRAVHGVSLVPVALKILHPRFAVHPDHRQHFLAEARKAGRVVHEHSSRVVDVGEDADGTVYIAMELVEGDTLDEWIHAERPLAPGEVVEILHQLCQALAVAHEVGLVHRDLSPRNIMALTRDGLPFVKILDFGISKGAPAVGDHEEAPVGFANPPYSAPEHLAGQEVDARADLYSLGVLAYEALTRRLPVAGRDKHELAIATIEGRVVPMRAPAGTPKRLVKLIGSLLSRDRELRPGSALEVRRELDRIRHPRVQVLRSVAVVALITSLTAFLVTHAERPSVYLQQQPGSDLLVSAERPTGPAQQLPSSALDTLEFKFGGFSPERLELAAYSGGNALTAVGLAPEVETARGVLRLSRDRSRDYADFIARLAAADGGFELVFSTPGQPNLAYARVLVDDDAPRLTFGHRSPVEGCMVGASNLTWDVADKGEITRLWLTYEWHVGSESRRAEVDLDPADPSGVRTARELLGGSHRAVIGLADVTVQARARDRAGNVGVAGETVRVGLMDLHAPAVAAISGRSGREFLTYDHKGATLRLELADWEPGVLLHVQSEAGGYAHTLALDSERTVQFLDLPLPGGDAEFVDGRYSFWVEDGVGNTSERLQRDLLFETEELQAVLRVASEESAGRSAVIGELIVTAGEPDEFVFECNPLYTPTRVTVRERGGANLRSVGGRGSCRFDLPQLPEGRFTLEVTLQDDSRFGELSTSYEVRVLPHPLELRLTDPEGLRFLHQLDEKRVLRFDPIEERIAVAEPWLPGAEDVVSGRVWLGTLEDPTPRPVAAAPNGRGLQFEPWFVLPGENIVGVELRDALGRPVEVRLGGKAPRPLPGRPGAVEIVRFVHQPGEVTPQRDVLSVEPGQSATLILRAPLPFRDSDVLRLRFESAPPLRPQVEAVGQYESLLTFVLPYAVIASEAGWTDLSPREVASAEVVRRTVQLQTPAGTYHVAVAFRPTRSTLQLVDLGTLANHALPAALGGIEMVPVLSPDNNVYRDPVPETVRMRSDFRPLPSIDSRNVDDCYLQSAELTQVQYQALLDEFEAPSDGGAFVHAWDDLGSGRFAALRPRPFEADAEGWRRAVAEAPDRPVTGVNFFQAYTMTRIAGHVLAGDPNMFRLPMGVEMELASLGAGSSREPGALHGGGRDEPKVTVQSFVHLGVDATAERTAAAGDCVTTSQGHKLVGLDFGVREWVLDLPFPQSGPGEIVLTEWLADHRSHVERVLDFARGVSEPPDVLRTTLRRNGVVRGVAWGDLRALIDTAAGKWSAEFDIVGGRDLPVTVPGVVRTLVLRRDGSDLLGAADPNLRGIGFRLAGGREFVRRVREVDR